MYWVEDDGQIRGVDRHAISVVIEVEKPVHVYPRVIACFAHQGVYDLEERFLQGKKVVATNKTLASEPVCHSSTSDEASTATDRRKVRSKMRNKSFVF